LLDLSHFFVDSHTKEKSRVDEPVAFSASKQLQAVKLSSILSENEDSVGESDHNCDFNYRDLTQEEYLNLSIHVSEKME
jgi:hypothetical protein